MSIYFDFVSSKDFNNSVTREVIESAEIDQVLMEAVDITRDKNMVHNRMMKKQYYLPKGTISGIGNICYLYSKNFDKSVELMTQKENFINANRYKFYYRDFFYNGKLYNKVYKIKERTERDADYKKLKEKNIRGVLNPKMTNGKNMFYDLYKHIEIFDGICSKLAIQKYIVLYWSFFSKIYSFDLLQDNKKSIPLKKMVLVNLKDYPLNGSLKNDLKNPLFLIYFTLLRYPLAFNEMFFMDIDFYFFNEKKCLIFNPTRMEWVIKSGVIDTIKKGIDDSTKDGSVTLSEITTNVIKAFINKNKNDIKKNSKIFARSLKVEMIKTMRGIGSDEDIDKSVSDENIDKQEVVVNATDKLLSIMQPKSSQTEITTTSQLASITKLNDVEKAIKLDVEKKTDLAMNAIAKSDIPVESKTKLKRAAEIQVTNDIKNEINEDREKLQKIYNQTKRELPKKSDASTARDKKLKEEQKKIMIGNMTIGDIEKIKAENIAVPVNDVSESVSTINENMKQIRYANLDKTYNEKLLQKDIINAFLSLNDKSIPLFILDVEVKDTSDELNYKDTYTIHFEDGNRKRHTIKVDIPKFTDGQLLYLGGNKKIIKHQSFYLPVVKISPSMVQIVTNYSKMTLERVENKSVGSVERLKKLVIKDDKYKRFFTVGNCYASNTDVITTIEYDGLSKFFTSYKNGKDVIFFDQTLASDFMKSRQIKEKDNYLFIGRIHDKDIFINIDTQMTDDKKTIVDVIFSSLGEELQSEYLGIKSPNQLMYATIRVMNKPIALSMLLGLWEGLSTLLKKLNVEFRYEESIPKQLSTDESFIKFKDVFLVYKTSVPIDLVMNGFKRFNTAQYDIIEMDEKYPYVEYMKARYGQSNVENALMNFYEFMIDNITIEILRQLEMPMDIVSLSIYAAKLLADSRYVPEINMNLSRIRCGEVVPAILYSKLAKAYINYRNSNGRKKYSIPQNAVIKDLLALKTVEDYSILNPSLEMDQLHAISPKGFNGVNLDESYTIPRRSYDPSMIGILSPSTSPDGTCGISRHISVEPNITNLRGFTEDKSKKMEELKDVNIFCPSEMTMPVAASVDDPNRLGHAMKQSSHVIPVKKSSPVLIANGLDEIARFHVTHSFAINAEEDGTIVDYDESTGIMIAKYKSGKCQAIDFNPQIVKNGGGGFYLSNKLVTDFKVGDKFKKNDCLAYHKDFFKHSQYNDTRLNIGTLAKVALMSTYNTYEDATIITEKLSEDAATEMVFSKDAVIGKNSNVFYMVKKGQEISVGDPLIQFDTSFEDETVNSLLAGLSETEKENILESSRNEIKSKYSGVIEDIKIYSTVELEELNPSLRKIVSSYYRDINKKKTFLEKYDPESKGSTMKCGVMITETTKRIKPDAYGVIKGNKVEDGVLIQFFIKHSEPLEVGSKVANFSALKNTVAEICPKGYEPYSEFRPEEEISTMIASNSILNRMVPSIFVVSLGNKCIIELKRRLQELNMDRAKMENMIYKFFTAFDKTGANTKRYKELFQPMSDVQFKKYFTGFFADEDAYLILNIVDYERTVTMEDVEKAAKVINIPLFEYVYLPHLSMDKSKVICTTEKVPVGYINIKRTQQTVMKKNGLSTETRERSAMTGQVTGHDKNGRESDMENIMLTALGMNYTLKELNAPRADDPVMKQQMMHDIALNGYTRLSDMTDDIGNKTTLNLVNTYFLGMTIKSDLVTRGLMLNSTLKKEM